VSTAGVGGSDETVASAAMRPAVGVALRPSACPANLAQCREDDRAHDALKGHERRRYLEHAIGVCEGTLLRTPLATTNQHRLNMQGMSRNARRLGEHQLRKNAGVASRLTNW
jgi:hypothetical protein